MRIPDRDILQCRCSSAFGSTVNWQQSVDRWASRSSLCPQQQQQQKQRLQTCPANNYYNNSQSSAQLIRYWTLCQPIRCSWSCTRFERPSLPFSGDIGRCTTQQQQQQVCNDVALATERERELINIEQTERTLADRLTTTT